MGLRGLNITNLLPTFASPPSLHTSVPLLSASLTASFPSSHSCLPSRPPFSRRRNLALRVQNLGYQLDRELMEPGKESPESNRNLYPHIEPYDAGFLKVSEIHTVYYEQSGNPSGYPVVFLHGGPGGGTTPSNRRFFDPEFFRIILFDQVTMLIFRLLSLHLLNFRLHFFGILVSSERCRQQHTSCLLGGKHHMGSYQ
uniref:Proline iminopeptidase isoform X2 n=1 Tax=Rhizophora mucronata TaxID=61149 RepID=A0A2P2KIR7_RHIMU